METSTNVQFRICMRFVVLAILSISLLLTRSSVSAQEGENIGDLPLLESINSATTSTRSSPFNPPAKDDSTFIVDDAPGLDTGCSYRDDGPLLFNVQVDRYAGDVSKLRANGLISEFAELKMPAFDVDYFGGGGVNNPERDRVSFNGNVVPKEFLTGDNGIWILNSFRIPIDWINFAKDPGDGNTLTPEINTIRIDIDTANTNRVWCTAIDWASLSVDIARPILLVHGTFSGPGTWDNWRPKLQEKGVPTKEIDVGKIDSFEANAAKIESVVNKLQKRWGIEKLNIIAHSKGGTDSRHFAEKNDAVASLIQLGTPNRGTPLADTGQIAAIIAIGGIPTAIIDGLLLQTGPALVQQSVSYMETIYNPFHGPNPNTKYVSLAGEYEFDCVKIVVCLPNPLNLIFSGIMGGANDLVVPEWSVHGLSYATHLFQGTTGSDFDARHTHLYRSDRIFNKILPFISSTGTSGFAGETNRAMDMSSRVNAAKIEVDVISQDQTIKHELIVDQASAVSFLLHYGTGNLDLTLISPSGTRIDPATVGTDPNIAHEAVETFDGFRFEAYGLSNPEVGKWTLEVTAPSVVNSSGQEPYFITALIAEPSIHMEVSLNQATYQHNDEIVVRAALSETMSPILNASVTMTVVLPNDTLATVQLMDDGSGDDIKAGDGIYSGAFGNTSAPGIYRFVVTANGQTPLFNRQAFILAPVSAGASKFTGNFSDAGSDQNGDGLFEELVVDVGINVTNPQNYRIFGVLMDKNGALVANAFRVVHLSAGQQSVALQFHGASIFEHGVDGPYTLSVVRLAEDNDYALLPTDERLNAHITQSYNYLQFQGSSIFIPGTGSDRGVDSDGNGLFDRLEVNVDVRIMNPGNYNWSTKLVDANNTDLGIFAGSGTLSQGTNSLPFVFDGREIGAKAVEGQFSLRDLLLFSGTDSIVSLHPYTTQGYSPGQFEGATPDLIVQEIIATTTNIQVVVKNQGAGPVLPDHDFWVDVYINPTSPPTKVNETWKFLGDWGLVWGVVAPAVPVPPGGTITLTINDPYFWPTYSNFPVMLPPGTAVYVQVDSANTTTTYGGVLENHEAAGGVYNNIFGPVYSIDVSGNKIHLPIITRGELPSAAGVAQNPVQLDWSVNPLPSRP